jgi:hypothetical protein
MILFVVIPANGRMSLVVPVVRSRHFRFCHLCVDKLMNMWAVNSPV